ncbi:DUF6578 domain-containing protein [Actinomadura parmotrematis]|uniref:DUF3237 domain-containing protein n=1 Tax=Actinomadura parmotrematis TaxID=2864039 RepID=A0ABS7FQA1_9ACTN|nr:DUF6578 domain-containing protein [Actinomadura parmotrematis]MBW8481929.1 hypothetical protein [Actinomadura parmotrematis]
MRLTIWVDDWQQECCGDPFAIGTRVTWTLVGTGLPDLDGAVRLDAAEDHHGAAGEGAPATTGTVLAIKAAHARYAPDGAGSRTFVPVPGTTRLTPLTSVVRSVRDDGGLRLRGYVVTLHVDG